MSYFTVKIEEEILLLDWLKKMHVAKCRINYFIDNKCCFVNGQIVDRFTKLKKNDYLLIDTSNYDRNQIKVLNLDLDFEIIYEDDYIIIVDKLPNYLVHDDQSDTITMTNIVQSYLYKHNRLTSLYPAHRLDQDTTGCLIFCKDIITLAYFSSLFEEKNITKTYLAIVEGLTNQHGVITSPIGKNRHVNNMMIICKNGKSAYTEYETLKQIGDNSIVRIAIKTGRTHQIRVHFSSINHPIVGDKQYGSKINAKRYFLHCEKISFVHPYKLIMMTVESQPPKDMINFAYRLQN